MVVPEGYVHALLDGKVKMEAGETSLVIDFHGGHPIDLLTAVKQLDAILAAHPELRTSNSARISTFIDMIKSACIPEDPSDASEVNGRQRFIVKYLGKLRGK